MHVNPGEYVTIAITSDNPNGPPVNLRWRPPTGTTNLAVTLTTETDGPHSCKFIVNCEEKKT